jgi:hypothetical protein
MSPRRNSEPSTSARASAPVTGTASAAVAVAAAEVAHGVRVVRGAPGHRGVAARDGAMVQQQAVQARVAPDDRLAVAQGKRAPQLRWIHHVQRAVIGRAGVSRPRVPVTVVAAGARSRGGEAIARTLPPWRSPPPPAGATQPDRTGRSASRGTRS